MARAKRQPAVNVCVWTRDTDPDTDAWDGSCGAKWCFTDGGPVENKMRFCPECGGPVKVKD